MLPGLRALGFVDAGYVRNNDPDGFNKPSSDRLASVGLGLRYTRGPFVGAVDYGRIVVGSRVPLTVNTASPQKGDDRLYVSLSLRF
jgi:hemolysin activation/secretion protein